jgi:hypothetical protein
MKKGYIYYLLAMFMAACSTEEIPGGGNGDPPTKSSSEVLIRLVFPASGSPSTRAITDTEEHKINTIDLLVFTDNSDNDLLNDKYAYKRSISSTEISNQGGSEKTISVTLENISGTGQRILLLANLPNDLRTGVIDNLNEGNVGITTEKQIIDSLHFAYTSAEPMSASHSGFPMFGQMVKYEQIDASNTPTNNTIEIDMIRAVARIDVKVDASAANYGTSPGFTVSEVYLCNVSDSVFVAPHDEYISVKDDGNTAIGKVNVPQDKHRTETAIEYDFPPLASGKELLRSIYVPETDSLIVTPDTKPAFLVIKATYNGDVENYYRVDFTKDATYVPLLRNHQYIINILGIKTEGYATLAAAMLAPPNTINLSVSIEGTNSDINDITTYSDQYLLGLSVNEVIFDWEKNPIGGSSLLYYPARVYSTFNGNEWSVVSTTGEFAAAKNGTDELRITASNENFTGIERTGTVTLQAGLITKTITVRQTGGANSIVVKHNGTESKTVNIPLSFLAAARPGIFGGKTIADFKDSLVWKETALGAVTTTLESGRYGHELDEGYITVTLPSSSGYSNAVVALAWINKGGPGIVGGIDPYELVWSWHIWVMPSTDAGYSSGGDVNNDFHNPNLPILMKRVLGKGAAASSGLYYQWGRKDPFFSNLTDVSSLITPTIFHATDTVGSNNINNAIIHPTTFYKSGGEGNTLYSDWTGDSGHSDGLWSSSSTPGTKTFYDPCPEGWRVPPQSEDLWFNGANIIHAEYSNGFIADDATLTGGEGYLWTATPSGNQSYFTKIDGAITHTGTEDRASALSVRCVKDLKRNY